MSRRKWHDKRVPTKISPTYRRPLELNVQGGTPSEPMLLGDPVEMDPVFVEANGMRVYGVRKGERRWVTGSQVQAALDAEWFILVEDEEVDA